MDNKVNNIRRKRQLSLICIHPEQCLYAIFIAIASAPIYMPGFSSPKNRFVFRSARAIL